MSGKGKGDSRIYRKESAEHSITERPTGSNNLEKYHQRRNLIDALRKNDPTQVHNRTPENTQPESPPFIPADNSELSVFFDKLKEQAIGHPENIQPESPPFIPADNSELSVFFDKLKEQARLREQAIGHPENIQPESPPFIPTDNSELSVFSDKLKEQADASQTTERSDPIRNVLQTNQVVQELQSNTETLNQIKSVLGDLTYYSFKDGKKLITGAFKSASELYSIDRNDTSRKFLYRGLKVLKEFIYEEKEYKKDEIKDAIKRVRNYKHITQNGTIQTIADAIENNPFLQNFIL